MLKLEASSRLRRPQLSRLLGKLLIEPAAGKQGARTSTLVGAILEDALREGASDIHLDPVEGGYQLRLRIDGALLDTVALQPEQGRHVLRSFKTHADLDPAFIRSPQDGRAQFQVGTVLGEKLALRLRPPNLHACSWTNSGSASRAMLN